MISEAVKHLAQMTGPRYLAGDLNHDLSSLPAVAQLHALHFVEIQDLYYQMSGIPPQPTRQKKVRRDYLFISAELVPFFRSVVVDHDQYIDHATVTAQFAGGLQDLVRFPWPVPKQIPWRKLKPCSAEPLVPSFLESTDCTAAYATFWQQVETFAENNAHQQGFSLPPSCKGRGQRLKPKVVKGNDAPVRAGRTGEIEPQFFGISFLHKHRFRQLRRIQSYVRLSRVEHPHSEHRGHLRQLWKAICRSPGFAPNFVEWWPTRPQVIHPGAVFTSIPVGSEIAQLIFEDLEHEVRDLESRLRKSLPSITALDAQPITKLYKAVKRDPPMQVDVLFQSKMSTVVEISHDDYSIIVDPPQSWIETQPVSIQGQVHSPIVVTSDRLWLENLEDISCGQTVVQTQGIGKLDEIFNHFIRYWSEFWEKHHDVPASQWQDVLDFARQHMPQGSFEPLCFTPELVRATVKAKKSHAAVGLDGVSKDDLLNLTQSQLQTVVTLFQRAGNTGQWPQQLLDGVVKSLAKKEVPLDVPDYRPITVFPLLYRVWSTIASKFWLKQIDGQLASTLCGNRNGYQSATLWRQVMEAVEFSQLEQDNLCGLVIDLTKAYNTLPRLPCMALALHSGVDMQTMQAWSGALRDMKRRFWINGSVSRGTPPIGGSPKVVACHALRCFC